MPQKKRGVSQSCSQAISASQGRQILEIEVGKIHGGKTRAVVFFTRLMGLMSSEPSGPASDSARSLLDTSSPLAFPTLVCLSRRRATCVIRPLPPPSCGPPYPPPLPAPIALQTPAATPAT